MTESTGDSAVLEKRLRRGDEHALAEIFSRHRERLWRMANFRLNGRLRGRVDPDDLLQESYLAAAKRLNHYGEEKAFSPYVWLRMILEQTLVDVHRRHLGAQKRDARRDVAIQGSRFSQTTSVSMAIQLVGDWTSPSQAAARAEMLHVVQEAVDKMEPFDREVLALRHF